MNPHDDESNVPDLILERYRLGELPLSDTQRLEQRLAEDEALRVRLNTLEISDSKIHLDYPPKWIAEQVRGRLDIRSPERQKS